MPQVYITLGGIPWRKSISPLSLSTTASGISAQDVVLNQSGRVAEENRQKRCV